MTTAEPDDPPIVYHPNGTIDLTMPAGRLTLPRPTFGQIKPLIRAQGALIDALNIGKNRAMAVATETLRETKEMADADPNDRIVRPDTLDRLTTLAQKTREVADETESTTQALLAGWWTQVFDVLITDETGRPAEDDWPSFFLDPQIPGNMISHWRFVPTGPG